MDKQKNAGKKPAKKRPLRRAQHWGVQVPAVMRRMLMLVIVVVVLGMMFSALQAVEAMWLRIALTLLIDSGLLLLFFSEGLTKGAQDAASSRSYVSLTEKGVALEKKDDAACYHPLKAVCGALAVFGLPLALALYVSLTAKPYTYTLQDLPAWLTDSYGARADVMGPLQAYAAQQSMHASDWVRLIVRVMEMIYINFFPDPQRMSLMIDRLSPLFVATYPAAFVLGYLRGPVQNRKTEKLNRRAKKVAVRRTQKSSLVEELTGERPTVHYGHRPEEQKHRKKELV